MSILIPFQYTGLILGPAILFAGVSAVALCIRATRREDATSARRALYASLLPAATGLFGGAIGIALVAAFAPGGLPEPWLALGNCTLAGLQITMMPLLWSGLLLRRRTANGTT